MNFYKKLFFLWALIILVAITYPFPEYHGDVVTYYDKVVHLFMFGIFAFLLVGAWQKDFKINKLILISFFAGIFYSALCEGIQYFVGRTVSIYDFIAGCLGVIIFLPFAYVKFKPKK